MIVTGLAGLVLLLVGSAAPSANPSGNVLSALNRDTVGLVNPTGAVRLQFDLDGTTLGHAYQIEAATSVALPVAGRWDADTTESVGLFRPGDATFILRSPQSSGPPTRVFPFFAEPPPPGDLYPLMGDWDGDSFAAVGVFDQTSGTVYLKNANDTEAPLVHRLDLPEVAGPSWLPVAGDWNGDGRDQLGLFDRSSETVRLYDELPATTFTEILLPLVGGKELWPLAGDWTADGIDGLGVYDAGSGTFHLLDAPVPAPVWDRVFQLAGATGLPVAGSWDGASFRYEVPRTASGHRASGFPQLVAAGAIGAHHLYFPAPSQALGLHQSIYYNRHEGPHLYTNAGWQLDESLEILGTAGAAALGVVLADNEPVFRHPDGRLYERLMVLVVEHPEPEEFAGWACLSYGSSPTTWTEPLFVTTDPSQTPRPCVDPGPPASEILAELVSGFRFEDELVFGVMNGDNPTLILDGLNGTLRTHTYLYTTTVDRPWLWTGHGEFESSIITPNTGGRWVYNYGINLDLSFDRITQNVFWSRSYPYPFDIDGGIPCDNGGCPAAVSQNPNRFQVYQVQPCSGAERGLQCPQAPPDRAPGPDFTTFHRRPWTLVFDGGAPIGYPSDEGQGCSATPLAAPFQSGFLGLDVNSVTFVKDRNGWVARDAQGKLTLVLAGAAVKDKAHGECDFADHSVYLWREP